MVAGINPSVTVPGGANIYSALTVTGNLTGTVRVGTIITQTPYSFLQATPSGEVYAGSYSPESPSVRVMGGLTGTITANNIGAVLVDGGGMNSLGTGIGTLGLGISASAVILAASGDVNSVTVASGDMAGTIAATGTIGRIAIQTGNLSGTVDAGANIIGSITVGGDMTGQITAVTGIMGDVMIIGSLPGNIRATGSAGDISGNVTVIGKAGITGSGSIEAGRSLLGSVTVQNGDLLGLIEAARDLSGRIYVFGTLDSAGTIDIGRNVTSTGSMRVGSIGTAGSITIGGDVQTTTVSGQRWSIDINTNMNGSITIGGSTSGSTVGARPIHIGGNFGSTGQLMAFLFGNVQIDGNFAGSITATGGAPGLNFGNILAILGSIDTASTVNPTGGSPGFGTGQGATWAFDIIQNTVLPL